ncbi:hypothetical protein QPK87_28035 [Kamptonema cortianum]|nr:hypothetical protein [Geitlerinema splendidum]MDK3160378.1 hypothetical protein [Kamptonema cortianum]
MTQFLVILTICLGVLFALGLVGIYMVLRSFQTSMKALDRQLVQLEARLVQQEAELKSIRSAISSVDANPLVSILKPLGELKQKGPISVALAIGMSLFSTYYRNRRAKALPKNVE